MAVIEIKNLHAEVDGKEILKGVNLTFSTNEVVALLGPNGHGKSTLLNVLMGHPKYKVTEGSVSYNGVDLLSLSVDERAKMGLFLAMQNPPEVAGINNADFLRAAINAKSEKRVSTYNFYKLLDNATKEVKVSFDLAKRNLNEGFSGGEKKRNEILQMILLNPEFVMLDEIDSGLDVDAIQIVSDVINKFKGEDKGLLVISHYARLFDLIHPTRAAVMINGRIVLDGDASLVKRIDESGYDFIKQELGISIEKEETSMNKVSIGSCAVKESIK